MADVRLVAFFALALSGALAISTLVFTLDTEAFEWDVIEAVRASPAPGDWLSNLVREVTTTEIDLVVGAVLALALWRAGDRRRALVFVLFLAALPLVQHELKELFDRDRPPYDPEAVWSEPSSRSFPSGHVMSATVVYGWLFYCALTLAWPRTWRTVAFGVAALALVMTAVTSVYLAVHWPSDVAGGYLWGLSLLLPAVWLAGPGPLDKGSVRPQTKDAPV